MQLVSQVRKLEGRLIQIEKNHENFQREVRWDLFFSSMKFRHLASTKTISNRSINLSIKCG